MNDSSHRLSVCEHGPKIPGTGTCRMVDEAYQKWLVRRGLQETDSPFVRRQFKKGLYRNHGKVKTEP